MDVAIKGWDINIAEIEFARRPDGSEWLLGEGKPPKAYEFLTANPASLSGAHAFAQPAASNA